MIFFSFWLLYPNQKKHYTYYNYRLLMTTNTCDFTISFDQITNMSTSVRVFGIEIKPSESYVIKKGRLSAYRVRDGGAYVMKQAIFVVSPGEVRSRAHFSDYGWIRLPKDGSALYIGLPNETRHWTSLDSLKLVLKCTCEDASGKSDEYFAEQYIDCPSMSNKTSESVDSKKKRVHAEFVLATLSGASEDDEGEKVAESQNDDRVPKKRNTKPFQEAEAEAEAEAEEEAENLETPSIPSLHAIAQDGMLQQENHAMRDPKEQDQEGQAEAQAEAQAVAQAEAQAEAQAVAQAEAQAVAQAEAQAEAEDRFLDQLVKEGRITLNPPSAFSFGSGSGAAKPNNPNPVLLDVPAFEVVNRTLLTNALRNRKLIAETKKQIDLLTSQLAKQMQEREAFLDRIKRVRSAWEQLDAAYK
jgi:hypothetical protein